MGFYVKAYEYFARLVGIVLLASSSVLAIIIGLNLMRFDFSGTREWIERYWVIVGVISVGTLGAFLQKILPTLRTLFALQRSNSQESPLATNKRMWIVFVMACLLLAFAAFGNVGFFSGIYQHTAARYGYAGDLLLLISGLAGMASLTAPSKARIEAGVFMSDTPTDKTKLTESQEQSRLYLAEILKGGMPRSVALTGDWGSGKTAVYRCSRNDVEETHNDIVWVDFDPWRYASEEALVKGFYESIAKNIDERVPGFQNALRSMAHSVDQLVSKNDKTGLFQALSTVAKDASAKNASPDALVRGLLEREGKRLVIVMDDIERQYDGERTYRALQLVHHAKTMSKDNVQVVCIFEKETLLRAAPLHMISAEEYLEKFSEIEISISPPEEFSLRAQLDSLLNDPTYSSHLPTDFDLKLSGARVRDLKSHRGVIRAFNELILEFISSEKRSLKFQTREEEGGNGRVTYVAYGDRFMMGHLKLKYPIIFRDIAANRQRYTQSKESEQSLRLMFMDRDELKKDQLKHFDELFEKANLESEQREVVKELLQDLFPSLGDVFGSSNSYIDLAKLRSERRVGYRDVLDAYFALTKSQDAYLQHDKWIGELLENIENDDDSVLIERFEDYMSKARSDDSEIDSITLLRNELLKSEHKNYQLRAFRAWMRAILRNPVSLDDENHALGRILSAVNDYAQRQQPETRVNVGELMFENIKRYIADPRGALLLLLFLLPERGNDYLADYIIAKGFIKNGLYQRVLNWVDNYFATARINIYERYAYPDWSFITYQWSLSSRASGGGVNDKVPGAKARFNKVNKYTFGLLDKNYELAYKVIERRFWHTNEEGLRSDGAGWRINNETTAPYDLQRLKFLVAALLKSGDISTKQRQNIKEFDAELSSFIQNQTPEDQGREQQ